MVEGGNCDVYRTLMCIFRARRASATPFCSNKLAVSRRTVPPKIVSLAGAAADSLPRHSGSSLDEGQDIRNLHLPEVAAAPSNFVADLPRIAECRSPRSETTKLSSFSLFYDGRLRTALTRYRNCFSRLAFVFNKSNEEGCLLKTK